MLAGRSRRTASRRGRHFLFGRRDGVLAYERSLTRPNGMHVDVPIFTHRFSDIYCIVRPYILIVYHKHLI